MIGDIEQGTIRCQSAASRLCAHVDRFHDPVLHKADNRDTRADSVCDKREAVVGAHRDTARLFANGDFGKLVFNVVAVRIFDPNDGETVGLPIDDNDPRLIGRQRDRCRATRCRIHNGRRDQRRKHSCRCDQHDSAMVCYLSKI